jgi:hypothetical protein
MHRSDAPDQLFVTLQSNVDRYAVNAAIDHTTATIHEPFNHTHRVVAQRQQLCSRYQLNHCVHCSFLSSPTKVIDDSHSDDRCDDEHHTKYSECSIINHHTPPSVSTSEQQHAVLVLINLTVSPVDEHERVIVTDQLNVRLVYRRNFVSVDWFFPSDFNQLPSGFELHFVLHCYLHYSDGASLHRKLSKYFRWFSIFSFLFQFPPVYYYYLGGHF